MPFLRLASSFLVFASTCLREGKCNNLQPDNGFLPIELQTRAKPSAEEQMRCQRGRKETAGAEVEIKQARKGE